jgi:hypothetical protein
MPFKIVERINGARRAGRAIRRRFDHTTVSSTGDAKTVVRVAVEVRQAM